MKMNKVKEFCRKHKAVIAFFAGAGSVCVGACIGALVDKSNKSKFYKNNGQNILTVLDDYLSKPHDSSNVFGGAHREGFTPSELGELGNAMLKVGCPKNQTFTHFIAIGEEVK